MRLLLGGIVTVTHTIGVFALGLVTLALSEFIVPEQLYPWLNLVSALLVVAVGVDRPPRADAAASPGARGGTATGTPPSPPPRPRARPRARSRPRPRARQRRPQGWSPSAISGGLLPCPTALVVLLAAISLHRVAYGLVLIVAFSVGLAAVVTGIGLLAVGAKQVFAPDELRGPVVRALPAVSALVIVALGARDDRARAADGRLSASCERFATATEPQ